MHSPFEAIAVQYSSNIIVPIEVHRFTGVIVSRASRYFFLRRGRGKKITSGDFGQVFMRLYWNVGTTNGVAVVI